MKLKKLTNTATSFFSLYLASPARSKAERKDRAQRVASFSGSVLIIVGAVTSLPAVGMVAYSIGVHIVSGGWVWAIIVPACVLYLLIVDFLLAAMAAYTFGEINEYADKRTGRERAAIILASLVVVILAIVSMRFSYTGNAAIVDSLFSDHDQKHDREILALDSIKTVEINKISETFDANLKKAEGTDKSTMQSLKTQGAAKVKEARTRIEAEARAKRWDWQKYQNRLIAAVQSAQADSAANVANFVPTAKAVANDKQRALNDKIATYDQAKAAKIEAKHKWHQSIETKSAAVFALTGGIGTLATPLGLFLIGFSILVSYTAKNPTLSGRNPKDLKDDFHTYHASLKRALSSDGDPTNSIQKISDLLAQIEETSPEFAMEKRKMIYDTYGVTV